MTGFMRFKLFMGVSIFCLTASVFASEAGNALEFDGVNDYVDCANDVALDITDALTIEAWFKGQFGSDSYHMIARKGACYYLAVYQQKPYARINTNSGWKKVQGATTLNNDQWYHLAMTYTTGGGKKAECLADVGHLKEDSNIPLIAAGTAGQWDEHLREMGNVLYEPNESEPNEIYKAFYSGHKGTYEQNDVYVGYAFSADGNSWTKHGKMIERALEDPYVIEHNDVYYMFAEDKADVPFRNIRRYHSNDCNTWIDDGDVLDIQSGGTPSGWESQDVSSPTVWIEDGTWYMLYHGRGGGYAGKIGLATSADGLNWTRDANNPVMDIGPAGSWDDDSVDPDDLVKIDGRYYLAYHGCCDTFSWQSGMAYSDDLINWTKYPSNPVLDYAPVTYFPHSQYIAYLANQDDGLYLAFGYEGPLMPVLFLNLAEESYQIRDVCNKEPIKTDTMPLNIGRAPSGDPFSFDGSIDEVKLYNKVLSRCELRRDMHGFPPENEPNLVGYWRFDEGSGQTVADFSSNNLDGHLGSDPNNPDSSDPNWVLSGVDWENMYISDYDDSGTVDFNDLREFCETWLLGGVSIEGDFDCDGIENLWDFAILSGEW